MNLPLHRAHAWLLPVLALLPAAANAFSYTITDLGTLGGTQSGAFGINDSGDIVGHKRPGAPLADSLHPRHSSHGLSALRTPRAQAARRNVLPAACRQRRPGKVSRGQTRTLSPDG